MRIMWVALCDRAAATIYPSVFFKPLPSLMKSGWMSKLSTRNRWQSRFFVLIDSELRWYKSEVRVSSHNGTQKKVLIPVRSVPKRPPDRSNYTTFVRWLSQHIPHAFDWNRAGQAVARGCWRADR